MKTRFFAAILSLCLTLGIHSAQADTVVGTNAASGSWSTAANWSPNAVPGVGDLAIITNAGVTVSLNGNTAAGAIILGTNGPGTVTLALK